MYLSLSQAMIQISTPYAVVFLCSLVWCERWEVRGDCSLVWGERWLFVLLILMDRIDEHHFLYLLFIMLKRGMDDFLYLHTFIENRIPFPQTNPCYISVKHNNIIDLYRTWLYIWVTRRVSYKKQELLTLREHIRSLSLLNCWWDPYTCCSSWFFVLSSYVSLRYDFHIKTMFGSC